MKIFALLFFQVEPSCFFSLQDFLEETGNIDINLNGENLSKNQGQSLPEEESEREESKEKVKLMMKSVKFFETTLKQYSKLGIMLLVPADVRMEGKKYAPEQKIYEEASISSNLD